MKSRHCLLIVLFLSVLAGPCGIAQSPQAPPVQDIVTELSKKGFNILLEAIGKTDLHDKLATGSFTLLAPTDNAFRDIAKAKLEALLADKEKLTAVLSNHIIEGKFSIAEMKSAKPRTLTGTVLEVMSEDGKITVNRAVVVKPDQSASNGVIHGIDKLFLR